METGNRESVYSAEELAGQAEKLFGAREECAAAALKEAGMTEASIDAAKEIVTAFLKKEVK